MQLSKLGFNYKTTRSMTPFEFKQKDNVKKQNRQQPLREQ